MVEAYAVWHGRTIQVVFFPFPFMLCVGVCPHALTMILSIPASKACSNYDASHLAASDTIVVFRGLGPALAVGGAGDDRSCHGTMNLLDSLPGIVLAKLSRQFLAQA